MANYIIELDPQMPERMISLGLCADRYANLGAVFAHQSQEDNSVKLYTFSLPVLTEAAKDFDPVKKPMEWEFRGAAFAAARRELVRLSMPGTTITPQFFATDDCTMNHIENNEVIGVAPMQGAGFYFAVGQIRGVNAHYRATMAVADPASGRRCIYHCRPV